MTSTTVDLLNSLLGAFTHMCGTILYSLLSTDSVNVHATSAHKCSYRLCVQIALSVRIGVNIRFEKYKNMEIWIMLKTYFFVIFKLVKNEIYINMQQQF